LSNAAAPSDSDEETAHNISCAIKRLRLPTVGAQCGGVGAGRILQRGEPRGEWTAAAVAALT